LYDRLLREGRILKEGAWELCTLFDVNFKPDRASVTERQETSQGELSITEQPMYDMKFKESMD
jgi:hypothetical protein